MAAKYETLLTTVTSILLIFLFYISFVIFADVDYLLHLVHFVERFLGKPDLTGCPLGGAHRTSDICIQHERSEAFQIRPCAWAGTYIMPP